MKYYLIAGEASGDLHASNLMQSLKNRDSKAEFRFFGGDLMQNKGGTLVKHYREMAFMGIIPVIMNIRTIFRNLSFCKKDGFFLMVEGSQVDWAAHANDPIGIITEYLAFDKAVEKVMNFAINDGNTAVIIMPDHGNSGFTIGSSNCRGYDRLSMKQLFGAVSKYKLSVYGIEAVLVNTEPDNIKSEFEKYTGIEITDDELQMLLSSKNYKENDYMKVSDSNNLVYNIAKILNSRTCFGYTTGGHTGEEVLLASYHPQDHVLRGNVRNVDVNKYLQQVSGLQTSLSDLSDRIFAKHTEVFADMTCNIDEKDSDFPILTVKKGNNTLKIKAHTSVAEFNGKPFDIGSVVVYIDKNKTFYLPKALIELF